MNSIFRNILILVSLVSISCQQLPAVDKKHPKQTLKVVWDAPEQIVKGGYPRVWYTDLDFQLDFLRDTIQRELDTYGYMYQKGMKYSQFLNLTSSKQAALAFAKAYERCSSKSYTARQNNAEKAYNYFVG